MKVYLIGSLRNPNIPVLGNELRAKGYEIFDDWYAAGERADDEWQTYEQGRGHTFVEALKGFAAWHVFEYDKFHIDTSDVGVLMLPTGKSGHIEFGMFVGQNKPTFILLDGEPERFDVMYRSATAVCATKTKLFAELRKLA